MRFKSLCLVVLVSLVATTSGSDAAVIGVSGAAVVVTPPPSVLENTYESNSQVRVFGERTATTLTSNVGVDISVPSTVNGLADFTPADLSQGATVSSTYVIFDPVGSSQTLRTVSGSITFDATILGIIYRTESLTPANPQLGYPGTIYPNGTNDTGAYGADYGQDPVTLSHDRRTVTFTFTANIGADSIRVVTAVPEPSAAALLSVIPFYLRCGTRHRVRT